MTKRTRTLVISATVAVAALVGVAPTALGATPTSAARVSSGRGACLAVSGVGGWCLVNPFDDLPDTPDVP